MKLIIETENGAHNIRDKENLDAWVASFTNKDDAELFKFIKEGNTAGRSQHQQRIDEFMKLAGQEVPTTPCVPPYANLYLRGKLILEETLETLSALGLSLRISTATDPARVACLLDNRGGDTLNVGLFGTHNPDLIQIADGCADISVVTIGTLSACGISDRDLLVTVDINNLQKFGPGGHRNADGKWVKPPNHLPPDIAGVLKRQGWEG